MKISKKSWHYRYLEWLAVKCIGIPEFIFPRTSLCEYFWSLCLMIIFMPFIVPVFFVINIIANLNKDDYQRKNKQPGLIISYARAIKMKACPLIEFTDE